MTNELPVLRRLGPWDKVFAKPLSDRLQLAINRWVEKQRWYLEKAVNYSTLAIEDATLIHVEAQDIWWLRLKYTSSAFSALPENIHYQLPLFFDSQASVPPPNCIARIEGRQNGYVIDAWQNLHFVNWFVSGQAPPFIERHHFCNTPPVDFSELAFKQIDDGQSNTSYLLGNRYFLKILRRLLPGNQPEAEMASELTRRGSSNTIPLISSWDWKLPDGHASLAMLSAAIEHLGTGWNWLQQCPSVELLPAIEQLGEATAALHLLLALPSNDPAFSPEPIDVHALQNRWQQRLVSTMSLVQAVPSITTNDLGKAFLQLAQQHLSSGWPIPSSTATKAHRIHGDYHLGQVLRTINQWYIIDFEGEPLRPLEERRAKDLPWRDVAGMLRSFGYLHHTLARQGISFPLEETRQAFLNAYSERLDPSTQASMLTWLPHYELEKALYEIEYEIRSRPDWLEIPLSAAVKLLQQLAPGESPGG